jgi:hypothetical protein
MTGRAVRRDFFFASSRENQDRKTSSRYYGWLKKVEGTQRARRTTEVSEDIETPRIRTGGVPASMHVEPKTILEIKGQKAVREFLAPLELFSPKHYANQCNCHGDPTIEIHKDGKHITSVAVQHSVALGWPDKWPAQMNLPNLTVFDKLNEEMAQKGFPKYKQEKDQAMQAAGEYIKNQEALRKDEMPIQKLAKVMSFGSDEWDLIMPMPDKLAYRDKDALYMDSDDREWDAPMPEHPLSRARRKMQAIVDALKIPEEIKQTALFTERHP